MSRSEDSDDILLYVEDAPIGLQQVYEALIHGKERVVDIFLRQYTSPFTERLTESRETALMVAIKGRHEHIINKLVNFTPPESLDLKNNSDNTALHVAAQHDNVEAAQLLVNKNHELLNICNERGILPIHLAALTAHRETTSYLFSVGLKDEIHSSLLKNIAGGELMLYLVNARFYDLALQLLDHNQDEEVAFSDFESLLKRLADDPSEFPNGSISEYFFYNYESLLQTFNEALPTFHEALIRGEETVVDTFLSQYGTAAFTRITVSRDTALVMAIQGGHERIIKKLVNKMPSKLLELKNNSGNTALHVAAQLDNVEAAQLLVNKNHELLNICNEKKILPIHLAALTAHRKTTSYLFSVGLKHDKHSSLLKVGAGGELILYLVTARFYDLALQLLDHNQDEEVAFNDLKSPLSLLASDPSVFPSRTHYSIWKSFFYNCVPMVLIRRSLEEMMTKSPNSTLPRPHKDQACQEILVILWKVLQVVVPPMKRISNEKLRHHQAIQLVKHFCSIMARKSTEPSEILEPFLLGAGNGIEEIVTEILDSFPVVVGMNDADEYSVFHYALMYRHEKIFKIVLQHQKNNISRSRDSKGNTILHLTGYRARQDRRLDLGPGPILQMQRELQWFMEIEKLVTRQESQVRNLEGKTPLMIFNEEHADLASMEIQWVTGMASACSVAASLIATVAFAAAITVPGGNNSNGLPFFSSERSFLVFAVSDALALFTSLTCVLCFLSIFTCRYGVKDFLYTLPNRVIYGLICLILSVISLMIAFSSTLFLVFAKKNPLILIPIVALTCVPVISYTFIQLPPLLDMINSTFGPGLFAKENAAEG